MKRPYHILLVDDDIIVLRLFQSFFKTFGCTVACVQSTDEAKAQLATSRFDLVLSDLQMGKSSGLEVIRRSKATNADTVAILMTGSHDPNHAEAARAEGADEVFFKPVSFSVVLEMLQRHGIQLAQDIPPTVSPAQERNQPRNALRPVFSKKKRRLAALH